MGGDDRNTQRIVINNITCILKCCIIWMNKSQFGIKNQSVNPYSELRSANRRDGYATRRYSFHNG